MAHHALRKLLQVPTDGSFDLGQVDPRATPGLHRKRNKAWARQELTRLGVGLAEHQDRLFAEAKVTGSRRRVLIVLQAMDGGGKDGTVHHVVGQFNPQGLRIQSFGPPTEEEREHDFLWRIRRALPEPGTIGVFNRSHYEDVLIARVHELVPPNVWQRRYDTINEFERWLAADGVTVLKIMLHISPQEQRARLLARLDDPAKRWKYNPADVDERARWAEYQRAYQDALRRCSTAVAPWHVVPADRKWYRDWAVAHLVGETLDGLNLAYPDPDYDVSHERGRLTKMRV
jgi:PPK2 family polyphosphate:nucleotide phosphotransferase